MTACLPVFMLDYPEDYCPGRVGERGEMTGMGVGTTIQENECRGKV
jgi:hypothetical protein